MPLVEAHFFHRLALAVEDPAASYEWFRRVLGVTPVAGTVRPHQEVPDPTSLRQDGAEARLLWHGGLPFLLLAATDPQGPVGRHLARWGTGVHSVAWEIDDMWTVDQLLRQRDIRVRGVNIPGRHFFMHPADTHGILIEWTDTSLVGDPRRGNPRPEESPGVVGGVLGIPWMTAVVADANAAADLLIDLTAGSRVAGEPVAATPGDDTVDVRIGDVVLRLVTPRSPESRFTPSLEIGPHLHSYTVQVPDLSAALTALEGEGVKVLGRDGSVAWTDPATTMGVSIEWTDLSPKN